MTTPHAAPQVRSVDHGPARTPERVITSPALLCSSDGTLAQDAVGWSRTPLHTCNLQGRWGRKKRWNHWCVHSRDAVFITTVAHLDYMALVSVLFRDHRAGKLYQHALATPVGLGARLGETVGDAVQITLPGMHIAMHDSQRGTTLHVSARTFGGVRIAADIDIALPDTHESLNVVIPWNERTFQFTSKHQARPARGSVRIDERPYEFDPTHESFGSLDFGRGIWPYRTAWNWAAGAGTTEGRTFGLNLGGQWTDGTGMTENGVWIDGRVHKIAEDLAFEFDRAQPLRPWRIHTIGSSRLELGYAPFAEHRINAQLVLAHSRLDVTWGAFSGRFVTDSGDTVVLRDIPGWAEDHRARW